MVCIAMAGVPVVAGVGAYVGLERVRAPRDDTRSRFPLRGEPARALVQQRHLPNLPLVTHDGRRVRFYDDLVKDKKVLLTFVSSLAPGRVRDRHPQPRLDPEVLRRAGGR